MVRFGFQCSSGNAPLQIAFDPYKFRSAKGH